MSAFVLKIIACISMVIDHIKYVIPETENFITIYAGRIAFPLFAFLIAEGYVHTKNLKKYYLRLIIYGIISQVPYMLFYSVFSDSVKLNIMFTLLLGLLTITVYDKIKKKYLSIPIICILIALSEIINVDYTWYGVATIFIMYICRNTKLYLFTGFGILCFIYYLVLGLMTPITIKTIIYLIFNYIIPIICITVYNQKQGIKLKYFFYSFYPIHLFIFYLLSFI